MKFAKILRTSHIQTVSKLFQPIITSPVKYDTNSKVTSRSQKLMLAAGIIHQAHNGLFHLLPLGTRALNKLIALVEMYMENDLGAQKISIPTLTSGSLWESTGRMELAGIELFKVVDRHSKEFILAPTHEESVTNLFATIPLISHRELPLLLYQISNKYRDEMRPRFGLIRSKEFLMKDLYSFDKSHEAALNTFERVNKTYEKILKRIGVDYLKVVGDTGLMGGLCSLEYHYPANIGDDVLLVCDKCNASWNENIFNQQIKDGNHSCTQCTSSNIKQHKGIEVGHTFLLGNKYSSVLNAQYNSDSQQRLDLFMGSYGLGLTRILGASLEVLSTENELRWPPELAPYSLVIITPKDGSKESVTVDRTGLLDNLCSALQSVEHIKGDIIVDDRSHLSIGRRLNEAKLTGYPNIIVIGKSAVEQPPIFEYFNLNSDLNVKLTFENLIEQIKNGDPDHSTINVRANISRA